MMLIAIDHGNKQIKTAHQTFSSGLCESNTRPPFGENILRYPANEFAGGSILLRRQIEASGKVGSTIFVNEIAANSCPSEPSGAAQGPVSCQCGLHYLYCSQAPEDDFDFDEAADALGADGLAAIANTMAMFRRE